MTRAKQSLLFPDLFAENALAKPVNVASVPQRSPFRYPGGKTWFVPTLREWITQMYRRPGILVEPFAGGGIISLTALFDDLVQKVVMVELDEEIAAVWQSIVDGDAEWLAKRILLFELTKDNVIKEIEQPAKSLKEKAFRTILKNRTLHGGILAAGSGFMGENGKGIGSRWYPETLAKRFLDLNKIAGRIQFTCGDGLAVMQEFSKNKDAIYFIDPPYTAGGKKAGRRLYKHCDLDHERLFAICESLPTDFLMTYDNAEEVKTMARAHGFHMRLIPIKSTHHATMEELVIGKDLSWMDQLPVVHEPECNYDIGKE
jgi:DNA adenine methylase